MASTNCASDGSRRSKVSAPLNIGPAGSKPGEHRRLKEPDGAQNLGNLQLRFTRDSPDLSLKERSHKSGHVRPQTDADEVERLQLGSFFLFKRVKISVKILQRDKDKNEEEKK